VKSAIVNIELSVSTNVEIGHFNEMNYRTLSSVFGAAFHHGNDPDSHRLRKVRPRFDELGRFRVLFQRCAQARRQASRCRIATYSYIITCVGVRLVSKISAGAFAAVEGRVSCRS
jgi:hypothetical protein